MSLQAAIPSKSARDGAGRALRAEPAPLLRGIATFGPVTARTSSAAAVLESCGTYGEPDIGEHTGIVIGDNIDLRIFPSGWSEAYALSEETPAGTRRSIEIFDRTGIASHSVVLGPDSNAAAYDRLVGELAIAASHNSPRDAEGPAATLTSDDAVDVAAYRRAFAAMNDTHDFFMLLRRFALTREQGLRLAGSTFAHQLGDKAHRALFAAAASGNIPLMIFVANNGMVQISSGCVPAPAFAGSWCALGDDRRMLRLHEPGIARAWAVRKPTVNGSVTSLEVFSADGRLIVQVFGERHEGHTERADWAAAIAELPAFV